MQTTDPKKANVYLKRHRSGNVTWCVNLGKKIGGKPDVRNFKTEAEAKNFSREWNLEFKTRNNPGLSDLSHIQRHEILAAIGKLEMFGATIEEAVDFYLKYSRPPKGTVTIDEALQIFLEAKARDRRPAYLRSCRKTFFQPFARAFPKRIVSEITPTEAEKYINSHVNWNPTSRASHISYLRTLYEFLKKKGYAKLNPFKEVEKPKYQVMKAKAIKPDQAKALLQFALDNGYKAECASMTLVFFCGIRVEEVERLNWENVDFERRKVKVEFEQAKQSKRRVNEISENALEWLSLCKSTGRIAPSDYLQRMKRLRQRASVPYPQNAMRHSFSAYHIARTEDATKTAIMLGHSNPALLYRNYYSVVEKEDATKYWDIVPNSIVTLRQREQADADADRRAEEEAKSESNCGLADRDENGKWHPIHSSYHCFENDVEF